MSTQNRTGLSRRRALKTGSLAALAAGLLGAGSPQDASAAPAPLAVGTVVDTHALTAESLEYAKRSHATLLDWCAASTELNKSLTPEQVALVQKYVDGPVSEHMDAYTNLIGAELARHFPGLAPALTLAFLHIREAAGADFGRCCAPDAQEVTA